MPVKAALAMMGLISDEIRLPLVKMNDKHVPRLREELAKLKLLPG
jgi:dihydrodipicolinate synthase/N-acetylneuraminate lyase